MATAREIRRRVSSVKNTQKITKAMEMVSSVKLRKGRVKIQNARPYADKLTEMVSNLRGNLGGLKTPLLETRIQKNVRLVVVTSDKGLCGAFNSNVVRKTMEYVRTHPDQNIDLTLLGKKSIDFFKRRKYTVNSSYPKVFIHPDYNQISTIARSVLDEYNAGTIDAVYIVYNEFKSLASQKVVIEQMLPVPERLEKNGTNAEYIFEPDAKESLDVLLPQFFVFQVWRVVLESYAAEQASRMAAMSGATKNAKELISKLTLFYNKARQAAITKELLEVVSGAEALK